MDKNNIVFIYFGLFLFGCGVGVYNFFVPSEIANIKSAGDYIESIEKIRTSNFLVTRFYAINSMIVDNLTDEQRHPVYGGSNAELPDYVMGSYHRLLEDLFYQTDTALWSPEVLGIQVRTGSGQILTNLIIDIILSGSNQYNRQIKSIEKVIPGRYTELLFIDYNFSLYSKHNIRIIISTLYFFGVFLLTIPSFLTSARILYVLFRGIGR
jgi:hypothetical protein